MVKSFIFLFAFFLGLFVQKLFQSKENKKIREDAIKRSRSVLAGLATEQLAPFLPDFPCNPLDAHFIGKPIDFVAFVGSGQGDKISEIIFIEVKSGKSNLSEREKEIQKLIENGKISYKVYRLPSNA